MGKKSRQSAKGLSGSIFNEYGTIGDNIRIDASTLCQLRCPGCFRSFKNSNFYGKGYLKFEDFKNFVSAYRVFKNIELASQGELFLNPDLEKIIEYASAKKIALTASKGVNLNTVSERIIKCLVRNRFKAIKVSIDGASQETYKIYRIGGNFDAVVKNIQKINYYKKKHKSPFPKLQWQFLIFNHNEHELQAAEKMAGALNMHFLPRFPSEVSTPASFLSVKNKRMLRGAIGYASPQEFEQKTQELYSFVCDQLWTSPQINWDGRLFGCCANRWGDYGNVFREGLENCLKRRKYVYAKLMISGKAKPNKAVPCFFCHHFKKIRFLKEPLKKIFSSSRLELDEK